MAEILELKQPTAAQVSEIPIGKLRVSPTNPRTTNPKLAGDSFKALVDSIRSQGILNPLIVVEVPDGYEIICGFRRFTAARRVGLRALPCVVRRLSLLEQVEVGLTDNLNRAKLDAIDIGHALLELRKLGLTQVQIAERVGRSQTFISQHLRLTELPAEDQRRIKHKQLTVRTALRMEHYDERPAASVFELDEELQRAWSRVRQVAIEIGDRRLFAELKTFARAWQDFQAVARQERRKS